LIGYGLFLKMVDCCTWSQWLYY